VATSVAVRPVKPRRIAGAPSLRIGATGLETRNAAKLRHDVRCDTPRTVASRQSVAPLVSAKLSDRSSAVAAIDLAQRV